MVFHTSRSVATGSWIKTPLALLGVSVFSMTAMGAAAAATVAETQSAAQDRQSVAVTIYNDGLALVRDERKIKLNQGENRIAVREVSAQIMPETASMRATDGSTLNLLEQNFDYDLLSSDSLLNKYVGSNVTVIRTNPASGQDERETATLLANNAGPVLKYADRIETGLPTNARLAFDGVPGNLRDQPTLVVSLNAEKAGTPTVDLSYLTGGLGWQADYVATLSKDENSLDLAGWVTLNNHSGTAYEDAKLQLVAGDVGRAPIVREAMFKALDGRAMAAVAPAPMEQEALFEYHLYTLPNTTTLGNNQTKQVALLSAGSVPVRKEYRLQGAEHWYNQLRNNNSPELGDKRKVDVFVEFDNKDGDLGVPLPKGIVRMYKGDSQQRALFIGEDRIDHIAKDEQVRLKLGSAFDLNGTWKHTSSKKLADNLYEMSFSIELRNAKEVPATITVVEPIPGDWTITSESQKHTQPTARLAQWEVEVPAEGKTELSYTVRIKY
ncbi:DUF4139 domain-containing protein [Lampropedia aestuarii]|uniref:DUF4139 domain-containing protein n=1 Tax=Lampropedia aestuarii TaxID=2562762 RepID=UPI0024695195|nr:DUF4139 domain-containing protein [Lampropedia aestuarii]MDH5858885.1 DUF4139 domain-containing protein [Lampropedia aestuarii]